MEPRQVLTLLVSGAESNGNEGVIRAREFERHHSIQLNFIPRTPLLEEVSYPSTGKNTINIF